MENLKPHLEVDRKEAEAELHQLDQQLEDRPEFGLGQGSADAYLWEMSLARREEVLKHIEELREALERVQGGTYGRCARCSEPIPAERLEILPTTTLCVACARVGQKKAA